MIISRTPFRVSFCGGGSDLPAFYKKHGGCVLSTSIDKYMYLSVHPSFNPDETILKYSKTEIVTDLEQIEHNYFKVILKRLNIDGIEVASTADIPAGTGLGSSSSFTVGLLHSLYSYKGKFVSKERLAMEACEIEIGELMQAIGKQDQYAAAYGGLNFYRFNKDGSVFVEPVFLSDENIRKLEKNLMLLYIGGSHSAAQILREQEKNISSEVQENAQLEICHLAELLRMELERGNIDALGEILHQNWILKKTLASEISNLLIDEYYNKALKAGAIGGKLLGAGGGGFLLLYAPESKRKSIKEQIGIPEMPIRFDKQGSAVIYVGQKPHTIQ